MKQWKRADLYALRTELTNEQPPFDPRQRSYFQMMSSTRVHTVEVYSKK